MEPPSFSFVLTTIGLVLTSSSSAQTTAALQWEPRMSYDATGESMVLGRHHPIVFANETHGFLFGGSTAANTAANDFYLYDESNDQWMDMTAVAATVFPPRSFGYGVVLNQADHSKAYLGFGTAPNGQRLNDLWEFDMKTLVFKQLTPCPCAGRRHPSMVPVYTASTESGGETTTEKWHIHIGLGDGYADGRFANLNDYWSYDITTDTWTQLPDFPSSVRHHPFFFGIGDTSYTGLGHSDGFTPYIERDFYSYHTDTGSWNQEPDFASYLMEDDEEEDAVTSTARSQHQHHEPTLMTTEARVAGTEFSIDLPLIGGGGENSDKNLMGSIGFVLSGDGDDHKAMSQGEFHAFYPPNSKLLEGLLHNDNNNNDGDVIQWRELPPHPGASRWAPGSFVMRGTARAYFTSGYDRTQQILYSDLWMIDLSALFQTTAAAVSSSTTSTPTNPDQQQSGSDVGSSSTSSPTTSSTSEGVSSSNGGGEQDQDGNSDPSISTNEPPPTSGGAEDQQDATNDASTVFAADNEQLKSSAAALLRRRCNGWNISTTATLALAVTMGMVQ